MLSRQLTSVAVLALAAGVSVGCGRKKQPKEGVECLAPAFKSGHCERPEVAWSFDTGRRRCQRFQYTGCSSSSNVFPTLKDCEAKCGRFAKVSVSAVSNEHRHKRGAGAFSAPYQEKETNQRYYAENPRKLCFRHRSVDNKSDCAEHPARKVWYFDRRERRCLEYDVCVRYEHLFFAHEASCLKSCAPLYQGLLPSKYLNYQGRGGAGGQYGGGGAQYGGAGVQYGGAGVQYGGAGVQYGGAGVQNGGAGEQYGRGGSRTTGHEEQKYDLLLPPLSDDVDQWVEKEIQAKVRKMFA